MRDGPLADGVGKAADVDAEVGQRVLDAGRDRRVDSPRDEPVTLQALQRLRTSQEAIAPAVGLAEVAKAHELVESGRTPGKIVLLP